MSLSPFSFVYHDDDEHRWIANDEAYFALAMNNARFAMGSTHPNPAVGAVIVSEGSIIGEGFSEPAGGMHAEKMAIKHAIKSCQGATLYVSLEPCSHFGRTPPCTDAIIAAGIKRVVYGALDPNPVVFKTGIAAMRAAGISVDQIASPEFIKYAESHIAPFKKYILEHLPYVIVKVASSANDKVALTSGAAKITGERADRAMHQLRRAVDAVMVGESTVNSDNPKLTARLGELRHNTQPERIVLSTKLKLNLEAEIFNNKMGSTLVLTSPLSSLSARENLLKRGVSIIDCPVGDDDRIDLDAALSILAQRGLTSILIEAGPRLLKSMVTNQLADEIWWLKSPQRIEENGVAAGMTLPAVEAYGYEQVDEKMLGKDQLQRFAKIAERKIGEGQRNL